MSRGGEKPDHSEPPYCFVDQIRGQTRVPCGNAVTDRFQRPALSCIAIQIFSVFGQRATTFYAHDGLPRRQQSKEWRISCSLSSIQWTLSGW